MLQQQPTFPVSFTEADVRRLCGTGLFERADRLQRAGHVLGPTFDGATLAASVRGTWRRVDQASVGARAGQLEPACGCATPGFCQHAGALLLHWLRAPGAFQIVLPGPEPGAPQASRRAAADSVTLGAISLPEGEPDELLTEALERDTNNHLRQIARARGVSLKDATSKAAIVERLSAALLDPAGIDLALAGLSAGERRVLDAAHLIGRLLPLNDQLLAEGYALLGGSGTPPTRQLLDRGLLVFDPEVPEYQGTAYMVPYGVGSRLPVIEDLLPPLPSAPTAAPRGLEIVPMVLTIVQELPSLELETAPSTPASPLASYVPFGYRVHPDDSEVQLLEVQQQHKVVRLLPAPLLRPESLERLAGKLGQPGAAVMFALRLLVALGALQDSEGLSAREDLLHAFYSLPPMFQLSSLLSAWWATGGTTELDLLLRPDSPLALSWNPYGTYGQFVLDEWLAMAMMLITGAIGRLKPGAWYSVESLVEKLWPLVRLTFPKLGLLSQPNFGRSALALAENSPTGKPFNLNSAGSAVQFFPILVAELLSGPLSWFGFVDLPAGEARPRAFSVRPAAGVLVDRIPVSQSPAEAAGLVVGDDLTVLIPIDHPDSEIHGLLAQAGELVEASPGGLRYRLTSERVQALFDQGVSGPEMLRVLDEHGATLPQAARAQLDGWWDAYGRVRLYDELTVIELADDRLLPELLAGTSLGEKLIYTFSPRLIAIDASAAGELVAELTRLGHAPRLVEGD